MEDPFLRSLFVVLGAEDILYSAQKDVRRYIVRDEGLLLSRSRKALICLSQNEVNTIVQTSLRSDDISTTEMLRALLQYIKWVNLDRSGRFRSRSKQEPRNFLSRPPPSSAHNPSHKQFGISNRNIRYANFAYCLTHVWNASPTRMGMLRRHHQSSNVFPVFMFE